MQISSYNRSEAPRRGYSRDKDALMVIKILSNENRYAIIRALSSAKGDMCVHELSETIGIPQSATSHQLAYLEACGVVEGVRMGKTRCYILTSSLLAKKIKKVITSLK